MNLLELLNLELERLHKEIDNAFVALSALVVTEELFSQRRELYKMMQKLLKSELERAVKEEGEES